MSDQENAPPGRAEKAIASHGVRDSAPLWRRAMARFLDGAIGLALFFLLAAAIEIGRRPAPPSYRHSETSFAVLMGIVALLYEWGFVARYGATPGKMIVGVVVTDKEGTRLSRRRGAWRVLIGAAMVALWPVAILALIVALIWRTSTPLHDKLTRTRTATVTTSATHVADAWAGLPLGIMIVLVTLMAIAPLAGLQLESAGELWGLWPLAPALVAQGAALVLLLTLRRRRPSLGFGAFTGVTMLLLFVVARIAIYW